MTARKKGLALALIGSALLSLGAAPGDARQVAAPRDAAVAAGSSGAIGDDLERAYKKEFTYLEAQKGALAARLAALESEAEAEAAQGARRVDALQARLIALTNRGDELEARIARAARGEEERADDAAALGATLAQARAALSERGVALEELAEDADEAAKAAALGAALGAALDRIERAGTLSERPGEFFGPGGRAARGTIIEAGEIAAWGVSEAATGALAPAGGGRLKVWSSDQSAATARAMAASSDPAWLEIFLFESLREDVEPPAEKSWHQIVSDGGAIGWVIVALGALGLLLSLLRAATLWAASLGRGGLIERVVGAARAKDFEEAARRARQGRGPTARVLIAAAEGLSRAPEAREDAITEALLGESASLARFGTAITAIAAVAPLLGLLGTVTGMIATFDVITEFGTGDPKMLSGGISVALITTQLGLIVAIPLLLLGAGLNAAAEGALTRLERAALRVSNASVEAEVEP